MGINKFCHDDSSSNHSVENPLFHNNKKSLERPRRIDRGLSRKKKKKFGSKNYYYYQKHKHMLELGFGREYATKGRLLFA